MNKGVYLLLAVLFMSAIVSAQVGFDVGSVLLKISVHKGDSVTRSLGVSSVEGGEFILKSSVQGVKLSEERFVLQPAEQKNVEVSFNSAGLEPGIYVGAISVTSGKDISTVPVVFEVESADVSFDLNLDIPPDYSEVNAGGKVVAQIKIFDLISGGTTNGLGANTVDVDYYVYGIDGTIISSESESVVVDRQAQITKTLSLPTSIKEGQYIFAVMVKHEASLGTSTYLFKVVPKEESPGFFSATFDWRFASILAVIVLFFVGLIFVFVYLIRDRDKMILELRRYNLEEIDQQRKLLAMQENFMKSKKNVHPETIKKEVKEKEKMLVEKHKQRFSEMRKVKDNPAEMKRKLEQWKKEGYNTLGMEYKLKGMSEKDMKHIMGQWKSKYNLTEEYKNKK